MESCPTPEENAPIGRAPMVFREPPAVLLARAARLNLGGAACLTKEAGASHENVAKIVSGDSSGLIVLSATGMQVAGCKVRQAQRCAGHQGG